MNNSRFLALFIVLSSLLFSTQAQVCISHRIIIGEAPENSLEGLDLAVAQSVAGIEFDVQFTGDAS
jgi:glycerophosphoryl diester phosphodiesterase